LDCEDVEVVHIQNLLARCEVNELFEAYEISRRNKVRLCSFFDQMASADLAQPDYIFHLPQTSTSVPVYSRTTENDQKSPLLLAQIQLRISPMEGFQF
jgi:hypothetical protein